MEHVNVTKEYNQNKLIKKNCNKISISKTKIKQFIHNKKIRPFTTEEDDDKTNI